MHLGGASKAPPPTVGCVLRADMESAPIVVQATKKMSTGEPVDIPLFFCYQAFTHNVKILLTEGNELLEGQGIPVQFVAIGIHHFPI